MQVITDQGRNKFNVSGDRVSHVAAAGSGTFMTDYGPVEKYLPDNAHLRSGRKNGVLYIAENQRINCIEFNLDLQNI